MSNILWKSLVVSPAILGASLLVSTGAIAAQNTTKAVVVPTEVSPVKNNVENNQASNQLLASQVQGQPTQVNESYTKVSTVTTTTNNGVLSQSDLAKAQQTDANVLDQVNKYSNEGNGNSQSQVTSVSQFSDVQPTDWAFQALQSLVERYGCIAGYPNGTYRGNRALTRYEFAAGLNACLDRVNELIATATADVVKKGDLATLQRLQEEFAAELASLRGRVDTLEARTAEIEAHQFSTTTKLSGEAVFALSNAFGNQAGNTNNAVFQDRVRLDLQTSFTGKDVLHTRLAAGNGNLFNPGLTTNGVGVNSTYGTFEGIQTHQLTGANGNTNNSIYLDKLSYTVPIGPANLYVAASGGTHFDYAATANPYFEDYDGGNGALSVFASRNPIYNIGGGAGAALSVNLGKGGSILKPSSLTIGYLGSEPNNPSLGSGIFNGNYAALAQLNFNLSNRLALAGTYVHGYHGAGSTLFDEGGQFLGSFNDNGVTRPVGVEGTRDANLINSPSSSNSYGISAAFKPTDKISLSGFVSYHNIVGEQSAIDNYQAWSYGVGLALPDLGKKGNVLGLFAGAEPYSFNRRDLSSTGGTSVPYHLEGFYKYRVSDNVSITPGVVWLTDPGQSANNSSEIIGTVRTTFTF